MATVSSSRVDADPVKIKAYIDSLSLTTFNALSIVIQGTTAIVTVIGS